MSNAPKQQSMDNDTSKTTGKWAIPASADPFFRSENGIDWDKWEKPAAQKPLIYDPPQLKTGWFHKEACPYINWWQQRSPCCAEPIFPCCCACCVYRCCVGDIEYLDFAEPDEWMKKMLSTGTSPNCPKKFQGIYWMHDNIAAHEHLVTWHDADWATDKLALKELRHNWTRGPTIFGACLSAFVNLRGNSLRLEISPNEKWISIAGSDGNPTWMYIPTPGETYTRPDGEVIVPDYEELQRIQFNNDADFNSDIVYQYRVRKIAYIDDEGNLVKTDAYKDLANRATEPLPPRCKPCFGYCWIMNDEARAFKNLPEVARFTVVKYAPPAPGSRPGLPGQQVEPEMIGNVKEDKDEVPTETTV